jgi:hypothetical protein
MVRTRELRLKHRMCADQENFKNTVETVEKVILMRMISL